MKQAQKNPMNKGRLFSKLGNFVFIFLIFSIFVSGLIFSSWPVLAEDGSELPIDLNLQSIQGDLGAIDSIRVSDAGLKKTEEQGIITNLKAWAKEWAGDEKYKLWEQAFHAAWQTSINNFVNRLAYDTATYIATGDKGQAPMFQVDSFGDFLSNELDNTAGGFLEAFGKYGPVSFNLCQPSVGFDIKIGLGLYRTRRPDVPKCTFTQMRDNWEKELTSKDFLNRFQDMFSPRSNDLSIALNVYVRYMGQLQEKEKIADKIYPDGQDFFPVTTKISEKIKTPASIVADAPKTAYLTSALEKIMYKGPGSKPIGIFINTLVSKLFNKWLKEGIFDPSSSDYYGGYTGDWGGFGNYDSSGSKSGIAAARLRFGELVAPDFSERGDYEILGELTSCPTPDKAGPTECVITESFRQAIEDNITVGEAIKQGYLNPNWIFGFSTDGLEPFYNEGYPYRSMVILRKYRIIPVGWELAAQYIMDNSASTDGTKNLGDLVSCFKDGDDEYGNYYSGWCQGLVDPNWVLKAPLNYCKKEGPGPQIITSQVAGNGADSELVISRNDTYCADEQTCIKETRDGECEAYGYCSEERRKWNFNGESCEPLYNTCETFRREDGATLSYLENTLDYRNCNADVVGCAPYCQSANYREETGVDWAYDSNTGLGCSLTEGEKIYLDRDAEECSTGAEGCHEFIRTKPGVGSNLLVNASFEDYTCTICDGTDDDIEYWTAAGVSGSIVNDSYLGASALRLGSNLNITDFFVGPASDPYPIKGEAFTLSMYAKDCSAGNSIIFISDTSTGPHSEALDLAAGSEWQHYSFTYVLPLNAIGSVFDISINSSSCIIDALKLERGGEAGGFSDYRGAGLVYQRLAPTYLGCLGAASDPEECENYVRGCSSIEVGCQMFTSIKDRMTVPAKVVQMDYCPASCVDYDSYAQSESNFDSERPSKFIPKTAKRCSIQAAGCDEFTNLDRLGEGAEAREYYKELRQCVESDTDAEARFGDDYQCSEFYTWEGSAETGYQLRVHGLLMEPGGDPELTNPGDFNGLYCRDEDDYDLVNNPFCRQFYNSRGEEKYAFLNYTVTCSTDCHPYRRTEDNILVDAFGVELTTCPAAGPDYYDGDGRCHFCKNGGEWDSSQNACIYMAIPGEGQKCSAAQAGCREYTGNAGANMRFIFSDEFESGDSDDWQESMGPSNESLLIGGHSLSALGTIGKVLGTQIENNRSYVLQFIGITGGAATVDITAALNDGTGSAVAFDGTATLSDGNWGIYELYLSGIDPDTDHVILDTEVLQISGIANFYIDNIRLIEITDHYYLIKDSWTLPEECKSDIFGVYRGEDWNLGCASYRGGDNKIHNLRQFSRLCDESAVGCEIVIDTENSTDFGAAIYNAGDPSEVTVAADNYKYVVYDVNKSCGANSKGCERLGQPDRYYENILYSDIFLKNDPDSYDAILCADNEVGCMEWDTDEGTSYFKDPGNITCEWRQAVGLGVDSGWDWFRKKVMLCDSSIPQDGFATSTIDRPCHDTSDCASGQSCILETADTECPDDNGLKTIGFGGYGNQVEQPAVETLTQEYYWAGLCPAAEAGCSEYIDPLSNFSYNQIFNPTFDDIDGVSGVDGWGGTGNEQNVFIEPYTLYRLGRLGSAGDWVTLSCDGNTIFTIDEFNVFNPLPNVGSVEIPRFEITVSVTTELNSALIYSGANSICNVSVNNASGEVELREAVIDYQIKQELDYEGCNGQVNLEEGCVLFNERSFGGSGNKQHVWDADATFTSGNNMPLSGAASENDTNVLLKVSPDRSCDKWLACRSYVKDDGGNNTCLEVGSCNALDENYECKSFVVPNRILTNQVYSTGDAGAYSNLTGYSLVGHENNTSLETDFFPLANMEQIGEVTYVPNGGFEANGENGYPLGWYTHTGVWKDYLFKVIDNPVEAQAEGISYPRDGRAMLKNSAFNAQYLESELIDVEPNTSYILSAHINTLNLTNKLNERIYTYIDVLAYDQYVKLIDNTVEPDSGIPYCQNNPRPEPTPCTAINAVWAGRDWEQYQGEFKTGPNTYRIKLANSAVYRDGATDYACHETTGGIDNSVNCVGSVYLDDIKIRPALENRNKPLTTGGDSSDYITQSCRLYPQDDSLACEYYEDSGARQKGWPGYCLQYDRYPGENDACLLWYPVDQVEGDGVEEGVGYNDRFPLYYTTKTDSASAVSVIYQLDMQADYSQRFVPVSEFNFPLPMIEYMVKGGKIRPYSLMIEGSGHGSAGMTFSLDESDGWRGGCHGEQCRDDGLSFDQLYNRWFLLGADCEEGGDNSNSSRVVGVEAKFEEENLTGFEVYACHSDTNEDSATAVSLRITIEVLWADEVVQVVTPMGQNKYWSGRVYEGSDFNNYACNPGIIGVNQTCTYISDLAPFGAIRQPAETYNIMANPYEWDSLPGEKNPGNQPLLYWGATTTGVIGDMPRMGQLHSMCELKSLFAQSYGAWYWDGSNYVKADSVSAIAAACNCSTYGGVSLYGSCHELASGYIVPPQERCVGARPDYIPGTGLDFCAIRPDVTNIRVQDQSDQSIMLDKSGFVNLTFNSEIDSQQEPLVMYAVKWGDNEESVVSGVEMRERETEETPHSLYHLYSYWDMRIKWAQNEADNDVYCAAAGAPLAKPGSPSLSTNCPASACCAAKPKVKIKDNWGWCNNGVDYNPCPQEGYEEFNRWVIVTESGLYPPPVCSVSGGGTDPCQAETCAGDQCEDECGNDYEGALDCSDCGDRECGCGGRTCGTNASCDDRTGVCHCNSGFAACGTDTASGGCPLNLMGSDANNCGAPCNTCPPEDFPLNTTCVSGVCTCVSTPVTCAPFDCGTSIFNGCVNVPCPACPQDCPPGSYGFFPNCDAGGASTPYLFTYTGQNYYIENDIMNTFFQYPGMSIKDVEEAYINNDIGTEYVERDVYKLNLKPAVSEEKIKLQIKEIEPEESNIDKVSLVKVIHSKESESFSAGRINIHNARLNEIEPLSCYEEDDQNCLKTVKAKDKDYLDKQIGTYIIVEFDINERNREVYLYLDTWGKDLEPKLIESPFEEGYSDSANSIEIRILTDGLWEQVGNDEHPRTIPDMRSVRTGIYHYLPLDEAVKASGKLRLRLDWTEVHYLNKVSIVLAEEEPYKEEILPLLRAEHSKDGDIREAINNKDYVYSHIVKGDSIDLEFGSGEVWPNENEAVDYFFVTHGWYHFLRTYLYPEVDSSDAYIDELNVYIREVNEHLKNSDAVWPIERREDAESSSQEDPVNNDNAEKNKNLWSAVKEKLDWILKVF